MHWATSRLSSPSDQPSQFQAAVATGAIGTSPVSAKPERPAPETARLAHHACSRSALTLKTGDGSLLVGRKVTRYLPNATEDQLAAASLRRSTRAAPGTGREVTQ